MVEVCCSCWNACCRTWQKLSTWWLCSCTCGW